MRTLQCHKKEQKNLPSQLIPHSSILSLLCISLHDTEWSTASAKQFQMSLSASNGTTLCHYNCGERHVVCLSRCNLTCHRTVLIYIYAVSQTQLKHEQGLFPLWSAIKKDILSGFCSGITEGLSCKSSRRRILEASPMFHGSSNLPVACRKDRHSC